MDRAEDELTAFIAQTEAAPRRREPAAGIGDDIRLETKSALGCGLELQGELLQLCAFSR